MKEFEEQLYIKQIEISDKLDYETIKIRKSVEEGLSHAEKNSKDLKSLTTDLYQFKDLISSISESIISLVELEVITSALE